MQTYTQTLDTILERAYAEEELSIQDKTILIKVIRKIINTIEPTNKTPVPEFEQLQHHIMECNMNALHRTITRVKSLIKISKIYKNYDYCSPLRMLSWNVLSNWGSGLSEDMGGFVGVSRQDICMLNRVFQQIWIIVKSKASVVGVVELDYEPIFTCLLGIFGYVKMIFVEKLNSPGVNVRKNLQLAEARSDGSALYIHRSILVRNNEMIFDEPYYLLRGPEPFHGMEYDYDPKIRVEDRVGVDGLEFVKVPSKIFRQVPIVIKIRLCNEQQQMEMDIVFIVAHLTANKHWGGEADRLEQFKQLQEFSKDILEYQDIPIVFMGDFNSDNQCIEVKGVPGSFYAPQLFPYIQNDPTRTWSLPQLDESQNIKRITSYKKRTINGIVQEYAYTPDRIMAEGLNLVFDPSLIVGLTGIKNTEQALTRKLHLPSKLIPSDHEPVLVCTDFFPPKKYIENTIDWSRWDIDHENERSTCIII
jgi:hypothetical protein